MRVSNNPGRQLSFLDDGTDEIAEYSSAGALTVHYLPGPAINEPVASLTGSTYHYLQTDHHGSVIATVSQAGNEADGPFSYDAYGNGAPTTGTPYKYVGMRLDPETGLYYDRARYYSPALGRFMQVDPVGYTDDLNLYTMPVMIRPTKWTRAGKTAKNPTSVCKHTWGAVAYLRCAICR